MLCIFCYILFLCWVTLLDTVIFLPVSQFEIAPIFRLSFSLCACVKIEGWFQTETAVVLKCTQFEKVPMAAGVVLRDKTN